MRENNIKYFGLDGIRGIYGEKITPLFAYKLGIAVGDVLHKPQVLIAMDTRPSGKMLLEYFVKGLNYSGSKAYFLGISTTPSVSYLTRLLKFDYGVMITSSHNPKEYNGFKFFNKDGYKLERSNERLIEKYIKTTNYNNSVQLIEEIPSSYKNCLKVAYVNFLKENFKTDLMGTKVYLDLSNGSAKYYAPELFRLRGAEVVEDNKDGVINVDSGILNIALLKQKMINSKADIGFTYDGDADRCMCVTNTGKVLDGDYILYMLAKYYNQKKIVGTVQTNKAMEDILKKHNIKLFRTKVGDMYISKMLTTKNLMLGTEKCGHITMMDKLPTGDGILASIIITQIYKNNPKLFKETQNLKLYSYSSENVYTTKKSVAKSKEVIDYVNKIDNKISKSGRAYIRASGTESVIRVVVEHKNIDLAKKYTTQIKNYIQKLV